MNSEQKQQESNEIQVIREATRKRMMQLFSHAGITSDMRHDLVLAWTEGRTASSSNLTLQEMRDLIWKFENQFDAPSTTLYIESQCKKLRSIVLKIATDCGIKEPTDFVTFNRFMKEYSVLKKELHKYTINELHDLIRQFRGLERNYKLSSQNPGTKAWYHSSGIPVPNEN